MEVAEAKVAALSFEGAVGFCNFLFLLAMASASKTYRLRLNTWTIRFCVTKGEMQFFLNVYTCIKDCCVHAMLILTLVVLI